MRLRLCLTLTPLLIACGGGNQANVSPAAALAISPQGGVVAGVTVAAFTATASDPDGDDLSYAWQFGDGTSASGPSATHVYQAEGTFPVVLTVRDSRGGAATAGSAVTARSLNGRWLLSEGGARFYERGYDLIQSGATLTGLPFSDKDKHCLGEISGLLTTPRTLSFQFVGCDGERVAINGTVADGLLAVTGTYTHPSGPPQSMVLSRP